MKVGRPDPCSGKPCRPALEGGAKKKGLAVPLARPFHDRGTPPGHGFHQAGLIEPIQSLAHGSAADAKLLGERRFAQRGVRGELS